MNLTRSSVPTLQIRFATQQSQQTTSQFLTTDPHGQHQIQKRWRYVFQRCSAREVMPSASKPMPDPKLRNPRST